MSAVPSVEAHFGDVKTAAFAPFWEFDASRRIEQFFVWRVEFKCVIQPYLRGDLLDKSPPGLLLIAGPVICADQQCKVEYRHQRHERKRVQQRQNALAPSA